MPLELVKFVVPVVVSFAPILKYDSFPLAALLDRLLAIGRWGMGAPVEIEGFVRFQVGEGIEKAEADFADEVAQMAGGR